MTTPAPIVEAFVHAVNLPYRAALEWTTGGRETQASYLVVRLRDAEGRTAAAESICKPAWNGVSAASLARLFIDVGWPLLRTSAHERDGATLAARVRGGGSLAALIDTLVSDFDYCGSAHDRFASGIPGSHVVTRGSLGRMREEIEEAIDQGYRSIKLKLGQGLETDCAILAAAREAAGARILLSADVNGACPDSDLGALLDCAADVGLDFIEDPRQLLPLAESVSGLVDARLPVVADRYCDGFLAARQFLSLGLTNLAVKPSRVGEATAKAMLSELSHIGGTGVIGLFGESEAGALVQLRVAATASGSHRAVEAGFHRALAETYLHTGPKFVDGQFYMASSAHLDSVIDWEKLARLSNASECLKD